MKSIIGKFGSVKMDNFDKVGDEVGATEMSNSMLVLLSLTFWKPRISDVQVCFMPGQNFCTARCWSKRKSKLVSRSDTQSQCDPHLLEVRMAKEEINGDVKTVHAGEMNCNVTAPSAKGWWCVMAFNAVW